MRLEGGLDPPVTVGEEGFYLSVNHHQREPLEGCDSEGPTICLVDDVDVLEKTEQARRLYRDGDVQRAAQVYDELIDAYDLRGLYNLAVEIVREESDHRSVRMSVHKELPAGLFYEVARAVEFELEAANYDDRAGFDRALAEDRVEGRLLSDVSFAVHY